MQGAGSVRHMQALDLVCSATKMQRKMCKSHCREHFPVNTGEQLAMGTKTILEIKLVFFSLSTYSDELLSFFL